MNTSIEIAVTCTWFQRRLSFMLSSILQQVGDVPKLVLSVAYPVGNGNPTTEDVCSFFRKKGLNIREIPYEGMEVIQYRGLVRNEQLKQADCEWILYADCDMSYSPGFFSDLGRQLEGTLKDEKMVISASRISLDKDYCKKFFNIDDKREYPCIVDKAGELENWPVFQISKNCGAGYFQLVNRKNLIDNLGGLYVNPSECRDWSWSNRGQKANSDKQFRSRVGGLKKITTMPQYHLNHERDNEAGVHLTNQR
jgi:hypothetical protein